MIVLGIIFLILFSFFSICLIGSLSGIQKEMIRHNKRMDEIIRITKR